ncbi:MAG: DUF362 domain-containing protein, partial [Actinomycetota bacterium]
ELVAGDISRAVSGRRLVMIKPNFVTCYRQLAATHVDAVRGVLDFIRPLVDSDIVIAEGAALGPTAVGYWRYGYRSLKREYGVCLANLNRGPTVSVEIEGSDGGTRSVAVSKLALDADCRISVAMLKTHDTVVATMTYKNMAMGSVSGAINKRRMHQGYAEINRSLVRIAPLVFPHVAVIDGMTGMEGNGPGSGTPVPMGVALAGTDFVAVDAVGARLMGINPREMDYLWQCHEAGLGEAGDEAIEVIGEEVGAYKRGFQKHPEHERQVAHLRHGIGYGR